MAFVKKDPPWKDRTLQTESNKGKRTITDLDSNSSEVVKFSKDEGKIYEAKTDFTAERMNDLEDRVYEGFESIEELIKPTTVLNRFYPVGTIYTSFDNTSPATLFGGTWESISGGLLMPSDDLPDTMIINNHVSPQYTDNNNNQTITPKGSMSGNITIGRGYAELPSHFHEITEHYSFFPGTKWESISEKELSSNFFHAYGGLGGSTKYTSYAGDPNNPGHTHTFKSGKTELPVQSNNTTLTLNNIPINIEKPALTVYCWVRVE